LEPSRTAHEHENIAHLHSMEAKKQAAFASNENKISHRWRERAWLAINVFS
jgi:hypothetical protein